MIQKHRSIEERLYMTEDTIYRNLIKRYRTWIFGMPASRDLVPLLKLRCSPDEAEFMVKLPFMPHTLEQLVERLGIDESHLAALLEPLLKKGLVTEMEGRSAVRYSLSDSLFIFYRMPGWKGKTDKMNMKFSPLANRYYINHMGADFMGHPTKGLRAIPVAGTVADTRTILPYEDILEFVEREDYHTVSTCACRHRHNLDPDMDSCRHETTNCLHFGRLGRYIVKHGLGKKISREETLDILKRAADAGLVHGISNYKSGMDTICNCCSCCCLFLETLKVDPPVAKGHQRSNYMVEHNPDTCKTCGLCEKRCPVSAITMRNNDEGEKQVKYNPDLCIGCGVCAHKCPTQSLKLIKRKGPEENIPENASDAGKRLLTERARGFAEIF